MTEREKIIEIVLDTEITGIKIRNITGGISAANAIADALIAAGIGEVTEWKAEAEYWEKICKFESDEHHTTIKNAAEHARHLMQERDEYKHRAEVAERAFSKLVHEMYEHGIRPMCDEKFFVESRLKDAEKRTRGGEK